MKEIRTAADLTPDPENANVGTKRGVDLLEESIERCGAGRSVLVDKHGVVIAGNKTLQAAVEKGLRIRVVRTNGERLVVVQRTDLDLMTDDNARLLAYLDNRASEVGLAWDAHRILSDMDRGIDLGTMFFPDELERLVNVGLKESADPGQPAAPADPNLTTRLTFATEEEEALWQAFIIWLKVRFPEEPTIAARLDRYLRESGVE